MTIWIIRGMFIMVISLIITGCGGYAEYKPPFLPVVFKIDTNGNVSISGEASFTTPLGEFEIGTELPLIDQQQILVIIRDFERGREKRYFVSTGRDVRVTIDGTVVINISSNGVVVIDIIKGTYQTIQINQTALVHPSPLAHPSVLNIRPFPTNSSSEDNVLARLHEGDIVEILDGPRYEYGYKWWKIRTPSGIVGWSVEYVSSGHRTLEFQ